jgi:hypothetical protein
LAPSKSTDAFVSSTSPPTRKSSDSNSHAGAVRRIVQRDSFNGTQAPKMFRLKRAKEDAGKMFGKFAGSKNQKHEQSSGIYSGLSGASSSSVNLTSHSRKQSRSPQRSQESTIPSLAQGSHTFVQTSFLRPVKCDVCCEKMWGLSELRCQGMIFSIVSMIDGHPKTNLLAHFSMRLLDAHEVHQSCSTILSWVTFKWRDGWRR